MTPERRMQAASVAATSEINDELVIILSSTALLRLEFPDGSPLLEDLEFAAQRLAQTSATLLNCADRCGAKPSAATLDRILEMP